MRLRTGSGWGAPFVLHFLLALLGLPGNAIAGDVPAVVGFSEAREPDTDACLLVVTGTDLRSVLEGRLSRAGGGPVEPVGVISPGSTTVSLALPADLEPGLYDLVLLYGSAREPLEMSFQVSLSAGRPLPGSVLESALEPALAEDLADAETLQGVAPSFFKDATNFDAGVLPTDRYSTWEDLKAEGWVDGNDLLSTDLFSSIEDLVDEGVITGTGRLGTNRFSAIADLAAEGYLDGWGKLKPAHFSAWEDLQAEGYLDTNGRLRTDDFSAWASLTNFGQVDANGVLGNSLLDAYLDLVAEGKVGSGANQVAGGDHDHPGLYLETSGTNTMTGPFTIDLQNAIAAPTQPPLWALSSTPGTAAVKFLNTADQYSATFSIGGTGSTAVLAHHTATSGKVFGIKAVNENPNSNRVLGATWAVMGLVGSSQSPDGYGVFVKHSGTGLTSQPSEATSDTEQGRARVGIEATHSGTSGDIARFQAGTANKARIDRSGTGYFNGGVQTGGADFAERVAVDGEAGNFATGEVLVIDTAAVRGFTRSIQRESQVVAGVVSSEPGVLAGPGEVAERKAVVTNRVVSMALAGIVPVKVCDENGPVEPGDLLVTSSVPGHAMKAPERPKVGTVLGKALGSLKEGRGLMEVLLRLR